VSCFPLLANRECMPLLRLRLENPRIVTYVFPSSLGLSRTPLFSAEISSRLHLGFPPLE